MKNRAFWPMRLLSGELTAFQSVAMTSP